MSLQPTGSDATGRPSEGPIASSSAQQSSFQQPGLQSPMGGLNDIATRFGTLMTRSTAGEALNAFHEAFKKALQAESEETQKQVRLLTLDGQNRGSALSSILVAHPVGNVVLVHTLVVAASAPALENTKHDLGNIKVELPTVPGDTNDIGYFKKIETVVREAYGDTKAVYAGLQVLPRELKPDDAYRVRQTLFYAMAALVTTADSRSGHKRAPFSVEWLTQTNSRLTARYDFSDNQRVETVHGNPVRSDVTITMTATGANATNDPLNSQQMEFSRASGYIDLVYTPPAPAVLGQAPSLIHYSPRFVMTRFEPTLSAITLELTLLSLTSSALLVNNMAWANVFRPIYGKSGVDLRDIGAIGYEVPALAGGESRMIDTKSANFTPNDLYSLLSAAVFPKLTISMDIEETGEMSFVQNVLVAAARGDMQANQAVVDALNNLTSGKFAAHYKGGPIFVSDNNRIFTGYYVDAATGQKEDIRNIDNLALLNWAGKTDLNAVADYAETFDNMERAVELRLEKRLQIQKKILGEDAICITGAAQRITMVPDALEAAVVSIREAGLVIAPQNTIHDFGNGARRGNASIRDMAYGGMGASQLFAHNRGPVNNGGFANNAVRWR